MDELTGARNEASMQPPINQRKVRIEKMKYPNVRYYSYHKRLLRETGDELILYNPPGLAITDHLRGGGFYLPTQSVTWCSTEPCNNIPAVYESKGAFKFWYCDVAMPCTFADDVLSYVDLDLDLIAYADGTYRVDDEDEFIAHQRQYCYPPEIIERARAELAALIAAHAAQTFPFDGSLIEFVPEAYRRA
jgi:protein associated with RNAse G/E